MYYVFCSRVSSRDQKTLVISMGPLKVHRTISEMVLNRK